MKKSIIICCILVMVGFLGISYAQDAVKESPILTADQQQAVDELISMDPKLSAEEIEQLKIAVLGAPAKAELASDPKEETLPEVVAAPLNAEPIQEREDVLPQKADPSSLTMIPTNTQPDGGISENAVNLHSLSIPGATQLEAPKVETVTTTKQNSTPQGPNPQANPGSNKPDDN